MNPHLVEQLTEILQRPENIPKNEPARGNHPELCDDVGRLCAALEGAERIIDSGHNDDDLDTRTWRLSKIHWLLTIAQEHAEGLSYRVGLR